MVCCSSNLKTITAGRSDCGCGCSCGSDGFIRRRFISPGEERKMLERYGEQLKNELEGLEARLKELEGK